MEDEKPMEDETTGDGEPTGDGTAGVPLRGYLIWRVKFIVWCLICMGWMRWGGVWFWVNGDIGE